MPQEPFPVAFVTSAFDACNLKHYLDQIRGMSTEELARLRSEIKTHARAVEPQQAFANMPGLSTHNALLKAIAHERLRRSVLIGLWHRILPIRQFVVAKFSGVDLKNNEYFGALYIPRNNPSTLFHLSHRDLVEYIGKFLYRNWFAVGSLLVAVAAVIVAWLKP